MKIGKEIKKANNNKRELLNIIGLIISIAGVIIIFFYGPPQPSFFPFDIITDSNIEQEVLDLRDRYELLSRVGLGFIFVGFSLQLIASSITYFKRVDRLKEGLPSTGTENKIDQK